MINWVLPCTLVSIAFFVAAWRAAQRDRYTTALYLLLAAGLFLRIGVAMDPFLHTWDERYHALVAKHLMEAPLTPTLYAHPLIAYDKTSWVAGHIWLHKPPFTLWCMAASMKLFGVNEVAVRIPSLIATTAGIWICFAITSRLFGRRTGFIAAFLFAIQGAVIEFGSGRVATDHVDTLLMILVSASVLCTLRYRDQRKTWMLVLSGVLLGLAILTKWLPAMMALPAQYLFLLNGTKRNWKKAIGAGTVIIITAVLVATPWMVYTRTMYPDIYTAVEHARLIRFNTVIDGQGSGPLYYVDRLRMRYGELVYLPCLWFAWMTIRKANTPDRWAVLLWILLPYAFFSCFATKMQGYVLPCTIPILSITAVYWTRLEKRLRFPSRWRWLQVAVLIAVLALPVRYTIERLKPLDDPQEEIALKQKILALPPDVDDGHTVVITDHPIETMFYKGGTAYEELSGADREQLGALGFRIMELPSPE